MCSSSGFSWFETLLVGSCNEKNKKIVFGWLVVFLFVLFWFWFFFFTASLRTTFLVLEHRSDLFLKCP